MAKSPIRAAWMDNLRTAIVVLVVNMHACVTYSHVGSWYRNEPPEPDLAVKIPFLYWQGHLQSFFMGLLFFLSGTLAHGACARRGPSGFVRERLLRLGAPAVFYMVVIHPFMVYVLLRKPDWPPSGKLYLNYLTSPSVLSGSGPLWFALALLFFCAGLALVRAWRPTLSVPESKPPPNVKEVVGFGLLLVSTTFAIRLFQPLDSNFLNFQLCFFPQYILAFMVGVVAGKHGWLDALASSRLAARVGALALVGGPLGLTVAVVLGGLTSTGNFAPYKGGWHGQALGLAVWEQLSGLGLALGSLALFRRRFATDGPIVRWLSQHSFAVYVLHAPVLVALTPLLRPFAGGLGIKTFLLTALGLIASFSVAWLAKKTPGLRHIL